MDLNLTGNGQVDRKILLKLDASRVIKACHGSEYINRFCGPFFFESWLEMHYPDTPQYRRAGLNWKGYAMEVIYYIAKLKEEFNEDYVSGDPKKQYIDLGGKNIL